MRNPENCKSIQKLDISKYKIVISPTITLLNSDESFRKLKKVERLDHAYYIYLGFIGEVPSILFLVLRYFKYFLYFRGLLSLGNFIQIQECNCCRDHNFTLFK